MNYEPVIGLEVHAQLKTKSKLFCGCSAAFEARENVHTCPVCAGMPGSLPVLNKTAVAFAMKMALATHCRVNERSLFARKNYFYPDLPKGYQISQYDQPLAEAGHVEIETDGNRKKIGLIRIHMEEDAGKNVHRADASFVNLNRAGVPLIEIVSYPDLRTPQEASAYLKELRKILRYLDISEANMEEGNLRCDVNVSLRPEGSQPFGTRAEIKNINSFRFVEKAIAYEIDRQRRLLERGQKVVQETRLWDAQKGTTHAMRSKEEAHDYRYFPEPDLRPLIIDPAWREEIKKGLPELPSDRKRRFVRSYQLSDYDADLLVCEKGLADYFEEAAGLSKQPKLVSNWILSELLREFPMEDVLRCPVTARHLGELVSLIDQGTISGKIAKIVFGEMARSGERPAEIVKKKGLVQITDAGALAPMIEEVLKKNRDAVEKYHAGNQKLFGFFVGQVMQATKGKANPALVHQLLKKKLGKS